MTDDQLAAVLKRHDREVAELRAEIDALRERQAADGIALIDAARDARFASTVALWGIAIAITLAVGSYFR